VRCGLEFDFLDVVVAADGTPYVSLVDGCTAEECHSRLGQGIVGHLVSGPPLVRTVGGRGLRGPIQLVRLARPGPGHDRGPDEHRADGGAHAPLSDVRVLGTER
jgi:hypothetical protein